MGTEGAPFDWFHRNSSTEDTDGILILSALNTHAIYKIDKQNSEINQTLGGKNSDFQMREGIEFAWRHEAHLADGGPITLLDNHVKLDDVDGGDSRGLWLALDEEA